MIQKDSIEVRKAALMKAARSAIRLRHSLAADAELAEVLPKIERAWNAAIQSGELPEVAGLLREFNALHDA